METFAISFFILVICFVLKMKFYLFKKNLSSIFSIIDSILEIQNVSQVAFIFIQNE